MRGARADRPSMMPRYGGRCRLGLPAAEDPKGVGRCSPWRAKRVTRQHGPSDSERVGVAASAGFELSLSPEFEAKLLDIVSLT